MPASSLLSTASLPAPSTPATTPDQAHAPRRQPWIGSFVASDGYRLHFRHWSPPDAPRARIVALHGIQSHAGWYSWSSRALAAAGYELLFLDRRGSGLNEPARGHTPHPDRLLNDVSQFLGHVRHTAPQANPAIPLVLLAKSWGGKLALLTAARRPELLDALALLYPGLCARIRPRADQRFRLALARLLGITHRAVPIPLADPALFTADPRAQDYIRFDPLALHAVTTSFLFAHQHLDRDIPAALPQLRHPTLLMLAGNDAIIDNVATRLLFARAQTPHLTIVEYHQARHTLEFDPCREQFLADLLAWLNLMTARHSPPASVRAMSSRQPPPS